MKQFGTIFKFELKYYLKNKIFVGITLFLVVLIAAVMSLPRIAAIFESEELQDPDEEIIYDSTEDLSVMLLKTENSEYSDVILSAFSGEFEAFYNVQLTDESLPEIQEKILSDEAECAFVLMGLTSFKYYIETPSMYDMNVDSAIVAMRKIYQTVSLIEKGVSIEEAENIINVEISSEMYGVGAVEEEESLGEVDLLGNFLYTYIMIFALYMVILLYGQMVSTNVATEKSSRAMEVLVTSAKPTAMMFGKVLASCFAGFIQLAAVFGSALLFYGINKSYWGENEIIESLFNISPVLLVYMLVFFVLGFLIYAFLFGAIGSTATKLEDINTSTLPLTFLFIIAFVVVMTSMTSGSVDNTLMKVCSFVPFTSPMAMFTRIAMSTVPWYEIAISIAILVGSVVGIGVLSAKIYRVGVLLYGTTPKLSAILKAVWKA